LEFRTSGSPKGGGVGVKGFAYWPVAVLWDRQEWSYHYKPRLFGFSWEGFPLWGTRKRGWVWHLGPFKIRFG